MFKEKRPFYALCGVFLGTLLAVGALYAWWTVSRSDHEMRADLLGRTRQAAQAVDAGWITHLSGTKEDLGSPVYLRVKEHLAAIRSISPRCRFVYLVGKKADGSVFFFADDTPVGDKDESPAGMIYDDVPEKFRSVFKTGIAETVGPYTDKWGAFISGAAPVIDPVSGDMIAVLGMDIDARDWNWSLARPVIIFSAFILVLAGAVFVFGLAMSRRKLWRYTEALMVAAVGLVLTLFVSWVAHKDEERRRYNDFSRMAYAQSTQINKDLQNISRVKLEGLAGLFDSSENVTSAEFDQYTAFLVLYPEAHAWEWIPAVTEAEKLRLEEEVRRTRLPDFEIWEKDASGRRIPATGRSVYYPVLYVSPLTDNERALGYDFGSEPVRRAAIEEAMLTGLTVGTDPVTLVQETASQKGMVVCRPVFEENEPRRLRGFALVALRMETLLKAAIRSGGEGSVAHYMTIRLFHLHAGEPDELLASMQEEEPGRELSAPFSNTYPVISFGKVFALVITPTAAFEELYPARVGSITALVGLVLTACLTFLAGMFFSRREELERLVVERTDLLRASEERGLLLLNSAAEAIYGVDLDGNCTFANPSCLRMLGYTDPAQLLGKNMHRLIHHSYPDGRPMPAEECRIYKAFHEGKGIHVETEILWRADGSSFPTEFWSHPQIVDGERTGAVVTFNDITERKKAEEIVSNAAKEWATTFDSMPEGVSVHGPDGTVLNTNKALSELLGKPKEELLGKKCYQIFHGKDALVTACPTHPVKGMNQKVYVEAFEPFLDRWLGISVASVFNDAGDLVRVVHIANDITERKLREERIHKLNSLQTALFETGTPDEKFKKITDSVVDIFGADFCRIWLIAPGDRCATGCVHASATEENHMCRYRDKCLHLVASSGRYTHIDGGAHARVPFGAYKIGGIASGVYPSFLTNDVANDPRVHDRAWAKELGLVSFAGVRMKPPKSETIGVLALFSRRKFSPEEFAFLEHVGNIVVKIVESAVNEEALRESQLKFETMFKSSKDAIMMMTPEGRYFDTNPAAVELFGYRSMDKVIFKNLSDVSPELQPDGKRSSEKAHEIIATVMEKGSQFFEWTHKRSNGAEFFATVLLTRMEFGGKTVLQATVRDVTELKRLGEMKNEFISMVSHELRTPLTALKESIDIVLDGSAGEINDEQKDFLDTAKRNIARLARLINSVLDYQRLESGREVFNMQRADVNAVAEEVVNTMLPSAQAKGLFLEARLAPELPGMIFDRDKITEVLVNLVNNAIKFTEKGGITITTAKDWDGKKLLVSVKDTGQGMKKEDIPRLFQSFSQLEAGQARKRGSTGLGLAISRKIIEAHQGEIWIESEEGKGSEFKFKLPVKTRYKILLADDNRVFLDACRGSFSGEDYEVICFDRENDAMEAVRFDKPDIVICGMKLRGGSGYGIIERLRINKETAMIPILAMSDDPEDLAKLEKRSGEQAFLSMAKPNDPGALLAPARSLLKLES